MNYEEMVKLAYEDILDNLVDEEDFEKEAKSVFTKMQERGLTAEKVIGSRPGAETFGTPYPFTHTPKRYGNIADGYKALSNEIAGYVNEYSPSSYYGAKFRNDMIRTGKAAKENLRKGLGGVSNPPGRTLEDIKAAAGAKLNKSAYEDIYDSLEKEATASVPSPALDGAGFKKNNTFYDQWK